MINGAFPTFRSAGTVYACAGVSQGVDGAARVCVVDRTEVSEVERRAAVLPVRHFRVGAVLKQHAHAPRKTEPRRLVERKSLHLNYVKQLGGLVK